MNTFLSLVKRNVKIFLRDRATVFFSFLSTIILVALYFLFIAKMYTSQMDNPAQGSIALPLSKGGKYFIVYLQMMAGVLVLNSMSLATGAFWTLARDFEIRKIDSLLLSPIKPGKLLLSYLVSGFIVSFGMNALTCAGSFLAIGLSTGFWLSVAAFFTVILVLLAVSAVSCSVMLLVTALVKSSTALGVINGIAGTFIGFLCGIYMPYSNLGQGAKFVGSMLPFSHFTIWLKTVVLNDAFRQLSIAGEFKEILLREFFSAKSIGICNISAPLWLMILLSALFGGACLVASLVILKKRIKK